MSDQLAIQALRARLAKSPELAHDAAGWKVSMNFANWQEKLGLTHSLAAPISELRIYSTGQRVPVALDRKIHIEAELALRLGADIRSRSDAIVVDSGQPCLELVDYAFPFGDLSTLFSHSFFHAGMVLGLERALAQLPSFTAGLPCTLNGPMRHERVAGTVPDDILVAVQQLACRVLEAGATLRRGQIVLCGSYAQPIPLGLGERVEAHFGEKVGTLSVMR